MVNAALRVYQSQKWVTLALKVYKENNEYISYPTLKRNNILYPLQHGFRDKRSCKTQLIEFVHDTAYNMQGGGGGGIQNDVVVMDFAKAFDKVAHNRLLYKLSSYGVKGNTLGWIGFFSLADLRREIIFFCSSAFRRSARLSFEPGIISHLYK